MRTVLVDQLGISGAANALWRSSKVVEQPAEERHGERAAEAKAATDHVSARGARMRSTDAHPRMQPPDAKPLRSGNQRMSVATGGTYDHESDMPHTAPPA